MSKGLEVEGLHVLNSNFLQVLLEVFNNEERIEEATRELSGEGIVTLGKGGELLGENHDNAGELILQGVEGETRLDVDGGRNGEGGVDREGGSGVEDERGGEGGCDEEEGCSGESGRAGAGIVAGICCIFRIGEEGGEIKSIISISSSEESRSTGLGKNVEVRLGETTVGRTGSVGLPEGDFKIDNNVVVRTKLLDDWLALVDEAEASGGGLTVRIENPLAVILMGAVGFLCHGNIMLQKLRLWQETEWSIEPTALLLIPCKAGGGYTGMGRGSWRRCG